MSLDLAFGEINYEDLFTSSQLLDEDTLESNMRFGGTPDPIPIPEAQEVASPPLGPPDRTPIQNSCNFKVEISSTDTNKNKYLYSGQLNRIYVGMNSDFAVQFSWRQSEGPSRPFVRATVVFTDEAQAEKRVERCVQHRHENSDLSENIRMHVLRSSREVGTRGVHYQGSAAPDSWYSVLVELTPPPASHAYRFVCKNSCSSGINRRPISVVYTLEDRLGKVYGRAMTSARVCSCPRRDLLRDETAEGVTPGKRKAAPTPRPTKKIKVEVVPADQHRQMDTHVLTLPQEVLQSRDQTAEGVTPGKRKAPPTPRPTKKIKVEVVPADQHRQMDTHVLTLPQLQVVGSNVMTTGLEVMVRMMEQGMSARAHDAQYVAQCTACIQGLNAVILQYRQGPQ